MFIFGCIWSREGVFLVIGELNIVVCFFGYWGVCYGEAVGVWVFYFCFNVRFYSFVRVCG